MGVNADHTATPADSTVKPPPSKRRRLNEVPSSPKVGSSERPIDLVQAHSSSSEKCTTPKEPSKLKKLPYDGEKRLRAFRKKAPGSYQQRYERAQSQRMFVIHRKRQGTEDIPEEVIELAGSTGNIYSVLISKMPTCTCPDNVKGNQCKHVIYVMCNVLKAPAQLRYQLAYLSSELREIFNRSPLPALLKPGHDSNRKSLDGECPVCFTEFGPDEDVVYCKSSCGNNVHKECFQQWAQAQAGREIRCIYCRAPWKCDDETREMIQRLLEKRKEMALNVEGYINVAQELGMSNTRDYSTYHQPWVVRRGRSVRYSDLY